MKKKLIVTTIALGLFMSAIPLNVSAEEISTDGLQISTSSDKTEYQENENPVITVSISNSNDYNIDNVKIESALPEELVFTDASAPIQEIGILEAGKTAEVSFVMQAAPVENDIIETINPDGQTADQNEQVAEPEKQTVSSDKYSSYKETHNSVQTGDHMSVWKWVLAMLIAAICFIIAVALNKKNKGKKFLALIMCFGMSGSLLNGIDVNAAGNAVTRQIFTSAVFSYSGTEIETAASISYDIPEDKAAMPEQNSEELTDIIFEKNGTETLTFDYKDQKLPVTDVSVDYTLKNGTGVVEAEDMTYSSYLSTAAGAVSAPVNFHVYEDELENAVITFKYDPSLLGETDPNALKIAWYDEENQQVVLLEDSVVNTSENTISVSTDHFSEYIVIDTNEWYTQWSIEQLVIRDIDGTSTPYYNVIFALDSSSSMSGNKEDLCKEATLAFIRQLKGNDKISVMSFDSNATVYIENKTLNELSMTEIEEKVSNIITSGNTNYEAGLNTALSLIVSGREDDDADGTKARQSLLIFLSDGEPTTDYSDSTLEQLKYLAETAGCRAVSIGLGSGVNENYLMEIADAGQGQYFYVSDPSQLANVFDTINSWYVGSTTDTDQDGIPDIVETTGMRTQFGEFLKTDPNNADTDGDGINDGEEIGTFVYRDNGKSEFKINSNPTIPTYVSNESKIIVKEIALGPVKPSDLELKTMSFEDIYNLFNSYQATFCAEAKLLDLAPDYLSETRYQDAQPVVDFKFNVSCANPDELHKDFGVVTAGSRISFNAETSCTNNLLNCSEDHNKIIFTVNNSNGTVVTDGVKKSSLDVKQSWNEILNRKKEMIKNEFDNVRSDMTNKTSDFLDKIQTTKTTAINNSTAEIENKVQRTIGFPANIPSDLKAGFLQCFYNFITDDLVTQISSYKNVKTSADLVNKIFKEIKTSDDTLEFTTPKGVPCTFKYKSIGWGGAAYFQGTLTNNSTNALYPIGGTQVDNSSIQTEMNYLKEYADLKIEEAKHAIITDTANILQINKLTSFLKDSINDRIFESLENVSPMLSQKAQKLYDAAEKYKKVVDAYEKIADTDFTDTDYDKLTDRIIDYTDALDNWYNTIMGL